MKARQKRHPGAFRAREPRSSLPYEQDTGLFQPRTPVRSRHDLRPAVFSIAAARRGRTMPSHFGLFSQVRDSLHRSTISSLARHRPACSSPFLPHHPPGQPLCLRHGLFFRSHLRVAPKGALARKELAVLPPKPLPEAAWGAWQQGGLGQGHTSAAAVINSGSLGEDGCCS